MADTVEDKPPRFGRVSPTPEQKNAMNSVRKQFEVLETLTEHLVRPGRYKSMALSKLEEAHMLMNKAITHEGIISS